MASKKITHANVRMYRMGTGDCFVIKFMHNRTVRFKMMIDGGAWREVGDKVERCIKDIKGYVNNHIHLLVVTHEHLDHVLAFDKCKTLFKENFVVDQIWMGWTENDKNTQVKRWKHDHGKKKRVLGAAAAYYEKELATGKIGIQLKGSRGEKDMLAAKKLFSDALTGFAELHLGVSNKKYVGNLKGLRVIKEDIADNNIKYLEAGDIKTVEELEGVRFFVLGPPKQWEDVETATGAAGETYKHNRDLDETEAFAAAALSLEKGSAALGGTTPFDADYLAPEGPDLEPWETEIKDKYKAEEWRRIDYDWLHGAGSLALRLNSHTNNLSLVLAIELIDNGKVMLFTGDAEYGSWQSWHDIDWDMTGKDGGKHLTEDLLNRTTFYKVAHHLSHNGTPRRKGLEMMMDNNLAAMASLDYGVISSGWKSTMPNRAILKNLLKRTKGRLMVMSEKDLFFNKSKTEKLGDKIEEARGKMNQDELQQFKRDFEEHELYLQYRVRV